MTVQYISDPISMSMVRDKEGHRDYSVTHYVGTDDKQDGPAIILSNAGVPSVGDQWNFGNEVDDWAFCWPNASVALVDRSAKGGSTPGGSHAQLNYTLWKVTQKFSTRPLSRCQDETIEDPLLEPDRISGTFVKYTKEMMTDRNGDTIKSSSHEIFRGPQVEFDANRPTVRIAQNVASLELGLFTSMIDTVNDATLWGLGARKIKLSNVTWERLLYGVCNYYYTRVFDFDVDFNTFDRTIIDEGSKVLNGKWDTVSSSGTYGQWLDINIGGSAPDKNDPSHFCAYKDRFGEVTRVLLDGSGKPLEKSFTGTGANNDPTGIDFEYYGESNFLLLGIPTVL